MGQRKFKIGSSSFSDLVARDSENNFKYYFVDKTLFIQQFLENQNEVLLIPRPRRFGKSTNLDMLRCFFSIDHATDNRRLFTGLKIESARLQSEETCMAYQGRYPVIHLSFKDLKQDKFSSLRNILKTIISDVYKEFPYLSHSEKLILEEKQQIQKFIARTAFDDDYAEALKLLISYLQTHHSCKVIVLIDEYDVPFQNAIHLRDYAETEEARAAGQQFLKDVESFFRVFLGALKDNPKLEKALMTGVVRIAGGGIFSDLNNMDVWTILDNPFSDSFGFTENELIPLLGQINQAEPEKIQQLGGIEQFRKWYNGYQFGTQIIYNPWSVMKALDRDEFASYWLETSNNNLIHSMLINPKTQQQAQEINTTIAELVTKTEVKKSLTSKLIFDTRTQSIEHLWILLLSAGYLKAAHIERVPESDSLICTIAIPNLEVGNIYKTIFRDWLQQKAQVTASSPLIEHLLKGEADLFCRALKDVFGKTLSSRDAPQTKDEDEASRYEAFYHGFMVGLLALSLEKNHHKVILKSNRESGDGYYDLVLEPKHVHDKVYHKGVIFEFKRATERGKLKTEAQGALQQIKQKNYVTEMEQRGVGEIVCIGVAFYQRSLEAKCQVYDAKQKKYVELAAVSEQARQQNSLQSPLLPSSSSTPMLGITHSAKASALNQANLPTPKRFSSTLNLTTHQETATPLFFSNSAQKDDDVETFTMFPRKKVDNPNLHVPKSTDKQSFTKFTSQLDSTNSLSAAHASKSYTSSLGSDDDFKQPSKKSYKNTNSSSTDKPFLSIKRNAPSAENLEKETSAPKKLKPNPSNYNDDDDFEEPKKDKSQSKTPKKD